MNKTQYIKKTIIRSSLEKAFAWHANTGAIARLTPPWAPLKMISKTGTGIKKGVKVKFKIKIFTIPMIWESEHVGYEKNRFFKDRQIRGPFTKWVHTHKFIPDGNNRFIMEDHIEFKLPFGILSYPFYKFAKKEFKRMFDYRHRILKYDLEHNINGSKTKTILISGASGTIGSALVPLLQTMGHKVLRLVRKKENLLEDEIFWDPYKGVLDLNYENTGKIHAVINFNGVDISKGPWTKKQKKKIIDSRVIPTRLLANKIKNLDPAPKVFISSSAIGFYGTRDEEILNEDNSQGDCFISEVCNRWEKAACDAEKPGIRIVHLRTGVVLTPAGGALSKMALPFRLGLGVVLSHGRQYMSWISLEDAISGIVHILDNDKIKGSVNLTAPNPVTNREFSQTLARVFKKKVYFKMPKFLVSLIWGEMGRETLLSSARVIPEKLTNTGFAFRHKNLLDALKHMLGR